MGRHAAGSQGPAVTLWTLRGRGGPTLTLLLSRPRLRWPVHQQRPRGPAALPGDGVQPAPGAGRPPAQARLRDLPGAPAALSGHRCPHLQDEVSGVWGQGHRGVLAAQSCLTPFWPPPGTGTVGTTSHACTRTRGAASSRRRTTASRWRPAACRPTGPRSSPMPTTAPTRASSTGTSPSSGGRRVVAGLGRGGVGLHPV